VKRFLAGSGAVLGGLGVVAGAFGAHALKNQVGPDMLAAFETGARYQMYHALALFAAAWLGGRGAPTEALWAGRLFVLGTLLFSGSLYAMALTNNRDLGIVTPVGGIALIAGWCLLALGTRHL
jgi:uncharacterized membrane protein YgdD (TMEM256/DUF423 family)